LTNRLDYVRLDDATGPHQGIIYYINYSCFQEKSADIEVAYFAHMEADDVSRARFFNVARQINHCVCQSRAAADPLTQAGIDGVTIIPPGVDLDRFVPQVRIGVVGRTYHTGRKGEHLVAQVLDMPGVEWCFTGDGWPRPGRAVRSEDLPAFYRSLDYLLVPSLYEGGPMTVIEALACGTPVIAPPVGWVPDFPHIEFKLGDAADLRRVIEGVLQRKAALRESVAAFTWDRWAEEHDRLFTRLARSSTLPTTVVALRRDAGVGIHLHGTESDAPGGPSVRVPRLATDLRREGLRATLRAGALDTAAEDEVVHVVNCWHPISALTLLRRAKSRRQATVFSPIFLDFSLRRLWAGELIAELESATTRPEVDAAFARMRRRRAAMRRSGLPPEEILPGYHAMVREMIALSDSVILLSEAERSRLAAIDAKPRSARVIRNAVPVSVGSRPDADLFARQFGIKDYVLCVGRIEPRKNQVALLHALRGLGMPLVLIGQTVNDDYRAIIDRHRWPETRVLDRLPTASPLLLSAYAGARAFVLPSWAEGGPLAALEAEAAGCNLVLSNASGEEEYFLDRATYCDPADPESIRNAIREAFETERSDPAGDFERAVLRHQAGWRRHVEETRKIYIELVDEFRQPLAIEPLAGAADNANWIVDVTTAAKHQGRMTGIARVEQELTTALVGQLRDRLRLIAWSDRQKAFLEMPRSSLAGNALQAAFLAREETPSVELSLPAESRLIVAGSAWMQNSDYALGVAALTAACGLRLTPLIHDVIPIKAPHWYPEGYTEIFRRNLGILLGSARSVAAVSDATRRDLIPLLEGVRLRPVPPVIVVREGSGMRLRPREEKLPQKPRLPTRPFALAVGAIHARKNHAILYIAWRRLAAQLRDQCPSLVIVGGVGWNGQEVARSLREDPALAGLITILDDVDDHLLQELYAACLLTVYPSLDEGWGLPVSESLTFGRICLAADIPSVREVAPDFVDLLDPLDPTAWAARVAFYARNKDATSAREQAIRSGYVPTSWSSTADDLVEGLAAADAVAAEEATYMVGSVVSLGMLAGSRPNQVAAHDGMPLGVHLRDGGKSLVFRLHSAQTKGPLLLVATLRVSPDLWGKPILACLNGRRIAEWVVMGEDEAVRHALVQAAFGHVLEFSLHALARLDLPGTIDSVALAPLGDVPDAGLALGLPENGTGLPAGRVLDLRQADAVALISAGDLRLDVGRGAVTDRRSLRLLLPVCFAPGRDLHLTLYLRANASEASPVGVHVFGNGTNLGSRMLAVGSVTRIQLEIPAAVRSWADPVMLDLVATRSGPDPSGDFARTCGDLAVSGVQVGPPPGELGPAIECSSGEWVDFAVPSGDTTAKLGPEWLPPDHTGARLIGSVGGIIIEGQGLSGDLAIRLDLRAVGTTATHGRPLRVLALIAGLIAGEILLWPGGDAELVAFAPAELSRETSFELLIVVVSPESDEHNLSALAFLLLRRLMVEDGQAAIPDLLPAGKLTKHSDAPALAESAYPALHTSGHSFEGDRDILFDFTWHGRAHLLRRSGWFDPEIAGTWTGADFAEIVLPLPREEGDLTIDVESRVFGMAGDAARVLVSVNDLRTEEWTYTSTEWTDQQIRLPAAAIRSDTSVRLAFVCPDGASPLDLGQGEDGRRLGLCVRLVALRRWAQRSDGGRLCDSL
jgi:glycosyltransferase involved in cell wall biosynthesis